MRLVVYRIEPDPVIIPFGGSVQVRVHAKHAKTYATDGDRFRDRLLLRLIGRTPNPPPVDWSTVVLAPIFLAGVTVVNNGNGFFTVSHSGA